MTISFSRSGALPTLTPTSIRCQPVLISARLRVVAAFPPCHRAGYGKLCGVPFLCLLLTPHRHGITRIFMRTGVGALALKFAKCFR